MTTTKRKYKDDFNTTGFDLHGNVRTDDVFIAELFFYEEPRNTYYRGTSAIFILSSGQMFVGTAMYSPKDACDYVNFPYDRAQGRTRAYWHAVEAVLRRPGHPDGTVNDVSVYSRIDREKAAMHLGRYVLQVRKTSIDPTTGIKATDPMLMAQKEPVRFTVSPSYSNNSAHFVGGVFSSLEQRTLLNENDRFFAIQQSVQRAQQQQRQDEIHQQAVNWEVSHPPVVAGPVPVQFEHAYFQSIEDSITEPVVRRFAEFVNRIFGTGF